QARDREESSRLHGYTYDAMWTRFCQVACDFHDYEDVLRAVPLIFYVNVVNHRQHNEEVNKFWNEIELMCLEQEITLRTKRCHLNISSKTQDMMENMAEETVEAHLETTKQRPTRKRKKICYTESSEVDHSSDSEYIEKPKGKQKPKSKRSHIKANCDGMDKVPSIETSEAPSLEDTTLYEITPSTSQQSPTSLETSENIDTSRESTPCPVIQSTQQTSLNTISTPRSVIQSTQQASIFTPQKPIITKIMYDRFSPYLICAFNATINYIKETVEEGVYIEVKNLLQAKDRLILQETLVKKLDAIFETDYTGIESKIFSETVINGDNRTEEARFNFFIRDALLDFVANFRYRMPRVLDREISERTYIVESLSPIFRAFRNAFPDIKYDWIEKNVSSIKEANNMFAEDINPRKTDLLIIRLSDNLEILNTEVSGPPFKVT
ncbi:3083_t:CDS:2, partial [Funneliformis geosporum]